MVRDKFSFLLRHQTQHDAMYNALVDTDLDVNYYDGKRGLVTLGCDILIAHDSVMEARRITPKYVHDSLNLALGYIDVAMAGGSIDARLEQMRDAADAVRRAHRSLMLRCSEYRSAENCSYLFSEQQEKTHIHTPI